MKIDIEKTFGGCLGAFVVLCLLSGIATIPLLFIRNLLEILK